MNAIYERYRNDPEFRKSLLAAVNRQRNAAMARFLAAFRRQLGAA